MILLVFQTCLTQANLINSQRFSFMPITPQMSASSPERPPEHSFQPSAGHITQMYKRNFILHASNSEVVSYSQCSAHGRCLLYSAELK